MTPLETYTKKISKLFKIVDNTAKINKIEKQLVKDIKVNCELMTLPQMISETRHSEDLNQIFNGRESGQPDLTIYQHMVSLKLSYSNRFRIIEELLTTARIKLTRLSNFNPQFASLNIDIKTEFEILNSITPFQMLNLSCVWKLPTFTLSGEGHNNIKFKELYLHFDFERTSFEDAVRVMPDKQNTIYDNDSGGFYHPHVNQDGRICAGEGEHIAHRLWNDKKVVPLAQLIINILSNYNERSPYKRLIYWKQTKMYTCDNCGDTIDETRTRFVDGDQTYPGCRNCTIFLGNSIKWKHQYVKSNYHDKWILKQNATKALNANNEWDYFENILLMPNFMSCPKCFSMVHSNCIGQNNMCSTCASKASDNIAPESAIETMPKLIKSTRTIRSNAGNINIFDL